jgi:hypothetical protein
LSPVAKLGCAFPLGAVVAAEDSTVLFQSMTYDADAAVRAGRRERVIFL